MVDPGGVGHWKTKRGESPSETKFDFKLERLIMRKLHWVSMALVSLPLALVACGGDDTTTTGTAGSAGAAGSGGSGGGAAGTAGTTGGSGGGGAGATTEGGAGTAVLEAGVL